MNLTGHRKITERAIQKLEVMLGADRIHRVHPQLHGPKPGANNAPPHHGHHSKEEVGPAYYAVQRDMIDVFTFNHWRDSG